MTEILTAAQMRAIEQAALADGTVTGLELMERAGLAVVEAVFEEWPELRATPGRAVVLCGPGNNGGDGFVVARLLKERGWEVEVFLYGDPEQLPPDARVNHQRWVEMGQVGPWPRSDDKSRISYNPWASDLIVDAVFGTGLTRPIPFDEANVGGMLPEWDLRDQAGRPKVVAIDVPSGLCADSGRTLDKGDNLWADLTVTFHSAKIGQFLCDGEVLSGKIKVTYIGLESARQATPEETLRRLLSEPDASRVRLLDKPNLWALTKGNGSGRQTHKYSHGHALILCGPSGRGGAARLAARGALRIGAGLVTLAVPGSAQMECAAQLTAIMLRRVEDGTGLAEVLDDRRINALCVGPGLGVARARDLVPVALQAPHRPRIVLDADALTAFAEAPEALFAMLHPSCVLTPHGGEFARLFPDIAAKMAGPAQSAPAYSKVDATREAAARAGCVVLYKGPDTVIAAPDGRCSVHSASYDRAAPWLATAGSGDVLAGLICGLLARGFAAMEAAETAVWLHVECALSFGPGLIAEDIAEELPKVFRGLGL